MVNMKTVSCCKPANTPHKQMINLATHPDQWPITGLKIASETGSARKSLTCMLGIPARIGLLDSSSDFGGGFRLDHPAQEIQLYSVVKMFESLHSLVGPGACCDQRLHGDDPCVGTSGGSAQNATIPNSFGRHRCMKSALNPSHVMKKFQGQGSHHV